MSAWTLANTYELLCELNNAVRPIRIEVFRSLENANVFRARVWEQTTYNLYPTWANMFKGEGLQNRMLSCDDINREITSLVADEPELCTGMECKSEAEFFAIVQTLIEQYLEAFRGSDEPPT